MKKIALAALAAAIAMGGVANAAKKDDDEKPMLTQPIKFGDQAMTCQQLIGEVNSMETILGGSPAEGLMDGEQMASIGTGLAQRAALSAGGGGAAFGAIGQVGGLLGRSSKKKKEREAQQRMIAEKRWIYLVGLYQGRNCDAEIAAAATAQPQPVAASVEEAAQTAEDAAEE